MHDGDGEQCNDAGNLRSMCLSVCLRSGEKKALRHLRNSVTLQHHVTEYQDSMPVSIAGSRDEHLKNGCENMAHGMK